MNNYQKNELTDDFSDFKSQALTPVYLQPDQYDFVNLLWAYAIFLRSQGKESIYAHLLTHNQAFGNPPLTTKQVGMINDIISSLFIKVNDNSLHSIATFWQADNDANIEKVDNPHHPKADLEAAKLLPKRIGDHSIAAYCMNFLPTLIIVNLAGKKSKMMAWYGCLWSDYSDDELHRLIKKTLCELPNKISDSELRKKMIKYVENSSKIQAVARSIKLEITQVAHDMLDHDPEILAVKNGKVDLRTGQFSLALKTDYLTISVGTDFIAGRGCPQFMEFINQIMEGNLKLIDFLQMLVGYCFLGENPERIIIFFLGAGRNGKSTLVNILMMLLGDYATAAPQKTLMGKNPDTLGDDLLALKGRRILTYNETDKNSKLSVGRLKSMSGNDHLIVRKPHAGEWHQIKTVGKMILSTNVLPIAEDDSDGFWDRLRIVPFNYRVPDGMVNPHI